MSCFKNFLIPFKLIIMLSTSIAFAEDPNKIIAAKVDEYIITAQDVLNAFERLPTKIKEKPLPDLYPEIVKKIISRITSKTNKSCKLIFEKYSNFGLINAKNVSMHRPMQIIESEITVLKPLNLLSIKNNNNLYKHNIV